MHAVFSERGNHLCAAMVRCQRDCNVPTPALFRSGCNGPEATIKSNSALSHILRRVVSG